MPYDPATAPPVNIVKRINGQILTGEMIPKRETPAEKFNANKKKKLSSSSEIPTVISTIPSTSVTSKNEMIPLLEEDGEDEYEEGKTDITTYGAVDENTRTERQMEVMKKLAFDLIV